MAFSSKEYEKKFQARRKKMLGMSHSAATRILYRNILLNYMQQIGDDICYKCGEKITDIDTLTIEHKEPWMQQDNPKFAFWDLNNITFSHKKCNTRHMTGRALNKPD